MPVFAAAFIKFPYILRIPGTVCVTVRDRWFIAFRINPEINSKPGFDQNEQQKSYSGDQPGIFKKIEKSPHPDFLLFIW
jgi:hypothetical protein